MKKSIPLLWLAAVPFLSFESCSKAGGTEPVTPPTTTTEVKLATVGTDSVGSIATSSAIFYGKISNNGGGTITDRGIYWGKTATPTDNKTVANSYQNSGQFIANLNWLEPNTQYFVRGYATNSKGTAYSADVQFKTLAVPAAELFTDTIFAAGSSTVFAAGVVKDSKGIELTETGICISKTENPTVADTKVASSSAAVNIFVRINGLEAETKYYARAYGTNVYGTTTYGENVAITTIKKGKMTYTLSEDPNATDEVKANYTRIKAAFDDAVMYYNNFTSIEKQLWVSYSPGTPTADGNFNGNIRVGSSTGYQRTGTAMHEIAHTVGVGTQWTWAANFISGGVYQGTFANRLLRFMTQNPAESVKGDTQHFWPYGINGASEDTGNEMLYIIHALIMQGMKADGLPSN
jgi:hypothetical protein